MSRPTGDGKISELSRRGKDSIRRKALLFNFDFDGEQLKVQHKLWLDENIVPLLDNFNLIFNLRGLASRTGSAAYNKGLSERRVANVRQYLISKGAKLNQFQSFGAGESDAQVAGQADGTEDEKFRGVVITVGSTARNAFAKFEQVFPLHKENGFDEQAQWIMVRIEDPNREIRIVNAAGFLIRSKNTGIAEVKPFIGSQPLTRLTADDEVIRIRGRGLGKTNIEVVDSEGEVIASLEVAVLQKLRVKTSFHYLKTQLVGTTRKVGDERPFLDEMNRIYLAQANIEFVLLSSRILNSNAPFGLEINEQARLGAGKFEFDELFDNRNPDARFNVFFVREAEKVVVEQLGRDDLDAAAIVGGVDCVFEDSAGNELGETLAHEAGHALGARHETPIRSTQDMLMWDFTDERGAFLPKVHVELMRSKVASPIL